MHVFTAIDIQNQKTLNKLEKLQTELDYNFNKVKPEKMHITLQFFQNVNQDEVEEIKSGLQKISLEPFQIKIEGVGVFPSKDHIRVIWTGIESEKIFELKNQVSRHSVEEDNGHEFHPHITLARVQNISKRHRKEFRQKLEKLEDKPIGETTVNSVKLFKSMQAGNGTKYQVLEEKKL